MWDVVTGREIARLGEHRFVAHAAFSPDGKQIATGGRSGRSARVWDAGTGKPVTRSLDILGERAWHVSFSPDGRKLLVDDKDAEMQFLFEATSGKKLHFSERRIRRIQPRRPIVAHA